MTYHVNPIPAKAGVGFKPQHYDDLVNSRSRVAWFEVHPENYFSEGGLNHHQLDQIRHDYPLSMHGIGLSLGSADGLDKGHLTNLKKLLDRYQPAQFSEHLSWSRYQLNYSNDLLPIPYTKEAMNIFIRNINQAQDFLNTQILIENPSSYFLLQNNDYMEWDFMSEVCSKSGARILLDINNLYVSSINHKFDALTYLKALPDNLIAELHLAGHSTEQHDFGSLLIDDHGSNVCDSVWQLYQDCIEIIGVRPTLIEWDNNIPEWDVLANEAHKADKLLNQHIVDPVVEH